MATKEKSLAFDPGFAPYILAFQGTIEYLYTDINRFKNLSQKKMRFNQFHKKILDVFYNNVGFYTGCLMWASYLKAQPKCKIDGNSFLGKEYNESENVSEIDYALVFIELFPKDMKYFLGQNFSFNALDIKLLEAYKEFLILNKGFVETEFNTDIKVPESVDETKAELYKDLIEAAIKDGNLNKLTDSISELFVK